MATTAAGAATTTGGGGGPSDHETTTPADAVVAAAPPSSSPLAPTPPPPPPRTTTKRCDGPCGLKMDESGYSITMWSRGASRRRACLVCSRLPPLPPVAPPLVVVGRGGGEEEGSDDVRATAATTTTTTRKRGATTTANLSGGGIDNEEARYSAAPPPRSRRRRIAEDGGGGAPPTRDGGGSRAVRPCCACRDPSACLELLRRWARLAEDGGGARVGVGRRAIEYVFLPRPSAAAGDGGVGRGATRAGRHADACRRVAFRGLGYDGDDGDDASSSGDAAAESGASRRVGGATGAEAPTDRSGEAAARTTTRKRERIALVHFHPDVVPYLLREGEVGVVSGGAGGGGGGGCCHGRRDGSDGRWRVPLDLGDAIGYAEEDACPDPDSNDLRTYFAVPNYRYVPRQPPRRRRLSKSRGKQTDEYECA